MAMPCGERRGERPSVSQRDDILMQLLIRAQDEKEKRAEREIVFGSDA